MILDLKRYTLDGVRLKRNEVKLLLLLSDNQWHSLLECIKYLDMCSNVTISRLISSIRAKTYQKFIITRPSVGYRISCMIEINY